MSEPVKDESILFSTGSFVCGSTAASTRGSPGVPPIDKSDLFVDDSCPTAAGESAESVDTEAGAWGLGSFELRMIEKTGIFSWLRGARAGGDGRKTPADASSELVEV